MTGFSDSPFPEPLMEERGRDYERELRWRFSRMPWRRRRAYEACLHLIRVRERDVYGLMWPQITAPPKRTDAATSAIPGRLSVAA